MKLGIDFLKIDELELAIGKTISYYIRLNAMWSHTNQIRQNYMKVMLNSILINQPKKIKTMQLCSK